MRMESMKLSDVSFTSISLEDSPRIIGTNIVFFSQGEVFFPSIYVLLRFGFVAEFLFTPYLCFFFRRPLYFLNILLRSRFVVQVDSVKYLEMSSVSNLDLYYCDAF
ncbi:hypothetical protein LXL04_028570 [Taraxacum kok-saghyz]